MAFIAEHHDYPIAWCKDDKVEGSHHARPVMLSEYVRGLENLVRSGDAGPEDLERLITRLNIPR